MTENLYKPVLVAAVRAASNVSDDQNNLYGRGAHVAINMGSVPGTDTVTFHIEGKNPATGYYYTILTSAAIVAAETRATGTVTLTGGASGSVNTVRAGGVNLIAAPVPFNASLNQTAADLAAAINALTSTHGYTAGAAGAVVTVTAAVGSGTLGNGVTLVSTTTTITKTDVNFAGGVSGQVILKVYPGVTVAANLAVSDVLPRAWRVRCQHSGPGNFNYTVGVSYVQ